MIFWRSLKRSILLLPLLTLLLGGVYPAVIWAAGKLLWPSQAAGSPLFHDGQLVGSSLIGQKFTQPQYLNSPFGFDYATMPASNPKERHRLRQDGRLVIACAPAVTLPPSCNTIDCKPTSNLTVDCSASGLDPFIPLDSALAQSDRIAATRTVPTDRVRQLIQSEAVGGGVFNGTARVNLLQTNLRLDQLLPTESSLSTPPTDNPSLPNPPPS
jgi:K+-transporting ATPase ATPase C chain